MKISAYHNTLIDFPGYVGTIIFTSGCNMRCPYCHNPALAKGQTQILSQEKVLDYLTVRKGFIDGVIISGGEPTLHRDLVLFCTTLKSMGHKVKLDTNGTNPDVLQELITAGLLDYVAMDIKSDSAHYQLLSKNIKIDNIHESIEVIKSSGIDYEFRTTCVPPFVSDSTITGIADMISGAELHVLQKFVLNDSILNPDYFKGMKLYHNRDLLYFQDILLKDVKRCIIRS